MSPAPKSRTILLISAMLMVQAVAAAPAQDVSVEAEEYCASHDIANQPIGLLSGRSCSGGTALEGLDFPGEYSDYRFTVKATGTHSVRLVCRGSIGVVYEVTLIFTERGTGSSQETRFKFLGAGFGWNPFLEVTGSDQVVLREGEYKARLEYESGDGPVQFDVFRVSRIQ